MSSVWSAPSGVYIVAEIGLNHNGRIDQAFQLIDAAVGAGADAVKFQKRDVASLAIASVLDARDDRFPSMGLTYRQIREAHEITFSDFQALRDYAREKHIGFFVTPFDVPSLEFLDQLGVDRFKVASHGVTNLPLLREIAARNKPVLLSSGMCTIDELDQAVEIFTERGTDLALLHCVSSYPTLQEDARLDLISLYGQRYEIPVGYSGHEVGFRPTLFAVAAGAKLVERHITLDNKAEGFDHGLSLNPEDFKSMVSEIRAVRSMFAGGPKIVTEKERLTRDKYQVSMVARETIKKGEILTESRICFKNPGTGITPARAQQFYGRVARVEIAEDTVVQEDQLE